MKLVVCTGWNLEGFALYGRRFVESFAKFWPADVALHICGEYDAMSATCGLAVGLNKRGEMPHQVTFTVLQGIPGCAEFLERHRARALYCGRERGVGHNWKERAVAAGYNWRYDAVKFSRQGFIPHHVAEGTHAGGDRPDFLCWLDGDVVSHARVPSAEHITALMPVNRSIAYLGREPKHPDIAFQLYDLRDLRAVEFLRRFRLEYATDAVFELKEWHSAYVWRDVLSRMILAPGWGGWTYERIAHNLTPQGSGHVWHQSPLRFWGDHLKGERKQHGRSPERR